MCRRSLILLFAAALALAVTGCAKKKGASGGAKKAKPARSFVADPAAAAQRWVPAPRGGAKYRVDGKPRIYDQETVFELLNGGADVLVERGLTTLLHVRVKDGAEKLADYEIQVWDVSTPAKAKAMLGHEKAPEAKRVTLGDAAWSEPGAVLVVRGRHLVRVMALPAGQRKAAPVAEVARQVLATPDARW